MWSNEVYLMKKEYEEIDIHNEKIERIVNVAFEEFSKYGEDKASLNCILKVADISKGGNI
jgi:hypothetical protein